MPQFVSKLLTFVLLLAACGAATQRTRVNSKYLRAPFASPQLAAPAPYPASGQRPLIPFELPAQLPTTEADSVLPPQVEVDEEDELPEALDPIAADAEEDEPQPLPTPQPRVSNESDENADIIPELMPPKPGQGSRRFWFF